MSRRPARRRLIAALALVSCVSAGCASGADESENSAADSGAVSSSVSSPPSSSPSSSPRAPSTSPSPPSPQAAAALPPFVASAVWDDTDHGVTLRVTPTPSARRADGPTDAATAWAEVRRLVRDADTPGMREQFDCHWTWARLLEPDKPTWNLEPWRPVVPAETMLVERCNPGGPEV